MEQSKKRDIIDSFKIVGSIIALLWIVLLITTVLPFLKKFGIMPRTAWGLLGIIFSPFLHAGFKHLITNSISLLMLGTIFLRVEQKLSLVILLQIIFLGGLGTWAIGKSGTVHIGASGVIYGILGYLLFIGIFTKSLKTILISIIIFFLYGGAVLGIFPGSPYVSWEGHLCGFLAGILSAKKYSRREIAQNY